MGERLIPLGELGVSALLYLLLLRHIRLAEPAATPWWLGYAQDVVNIVTLILFTIGLRQFDFVLPSALLGAFFGTLFLYLLDWLIAWLLGRGRPRARYFAFVICSGVVLAALVTLGSAHRAAERAIGRLIQSALPRPPPVKT